MTVATPLPTFLTQRYQDWKANTYPQQQARYEDLAENGQKPRAMVISCCDSRVHATALFGVDTGEFFMHRNIANLIPPQEADGANHATAAAMEYAITVLKVSHLIVLGHSKCGGVQGAYSKCAGDAPALEAPSSFVGKWIEFLRPAYDRVVGTGTAESEVAALERAGVVTSLENAMGYGFVRDAVAAGDLTLHGLWTDIGTADLLYYTGTDFQPVAP